MVAGKILLDLGMALLGGDALNLGMARCCVADYVAVQERLLFTALGL